MIRILLNGKRAPIVVLLLAMMGIAIRSVYASSMTEVLIVNSTSALGVTMKLKAPAYQKGGDNVATVVTLELENTTDNGIAIEGNSDEFDVVVLENFSEIVPRKNAVNKRTTNRALHPMTELVGGSHLSRRINLSEEFQLPKSGLITVRVQKCVVTSVEGHVSFPIESSCTFQLGERRRLLPAD